MITLYDLNRSKNHDLAYHSHEKFDLDSLSQDECKSEFRFDTYTGCVTFLKFQKKLDVIMEWFSTKKKLYAFS